MAKYPETPERLCICAQGDALDAREQANYQASIRETERRVTTGVPVSPWPPLAGPTQDAHDKRVAQLLTENCRLRVELANAEAERDAALCRVRELEGNI